MGAAMSIVEHPKAKKAKNRMTKLVSTAWWLGGNVLWTVATGFLVLGVPVFAEYERECQLFEQMAQAQSAQMNAQPPALRGCGSATQSQPLAPTGIGQHAAAPA
eukprot:CAMPEP_0176098564 /NCGR_PEP_ID=MMETSP0120_2-20121206/49422_1 /TAXON_ID=160619 /ORGANISM="Kryptoperidinium foliaceum, Strain CCMP 1326" /LENGTH=103 /DNA_ID=CAMNT_0017432577 /DNA_START=39 /DNA_END=346 /DNA_ORIENTATION=+